MTTNTTTTTTTTATATTTGCRVFTVGNGVWSSAVMVDQNADGTVTVTCANADMMCNGFVQTCRDFADAASVMSNACAWMDACHPSDCSSQRFVPTDSGVRVSGFHRVADAPVTTAQVNWDTPDWGRMR